MRTRSFGLSLCMAARGVVTAASVALACPAAAQVLSAPWKQRAERQIETHRKTDVRVIVQDAAGEPVPDAQVRIEQRRHDFAIGFGVPRAGWPDVRGDEPVWRCFNAVSLHHLTPWSRLQPDGPRQWKIEPIEDAVHLARLHGLTVRWGSVISADTGRNPGWVGFLEGSKLRAVLEDHLEHVLFGFGQRVEQFDLYANSLDHDFVERRLGEPMVRLLFERAKAIAPRATICIQFEDSLTGPRLEQMVQRITDMRPFIPIDMIAIEQRITGLMLEAPLSRGLNLLGTLEQDVVISSLEVGGGSESGAAANLDTIMRSLFASPQIKGVWFAGLMPAEVADPYAALFDERGEPTKAGLRLDELFRGTWWTDLTEPTDELGNVYARVFAGTHEITATLPDGTVLHTVVYLAHRPPHGRPTHYVLLEPLRHDREAVSTPPGDAGEVEPTEPVEREPGSADPRPSEPPDEDRGDEDEDVVGEPDA